MCCVGERGHFTIHLYLNLHAESASVPLSHEAMQALILAEGRSSDTCQQRANY